MYKIRLAALGWGVERAGIRGDNGGFWGGGWFHAYRKQRETDGARAKGMGKEASGGYDSMLPGKKKRSSLVTQRTPSPDLRCFCIECRGKRVM